MVNEINLDYIKKAINKLTKSVGIKEPKYNTQILNNIRDDNVNAAIELIAMQLGLPININLTNVPSSYKAQNDNNRFSSNELEEGHKYGTGNEETAAQVYIPENLPSYGSTALNGFTIDIKISNDSTRRPETFVMVMAHELSHVLLYSLSHPKKEDEFYTDLTAMILGFQNTFQKGRKIKEKRFLHGTTRTTQTTTYGYLNDEQFNFAYNRITEILNRKRDKRGVLLEKVNNFSELLDKYEKTLQNFKKYLSLLSEETDLKITGEDGKRITKFFQYGYIKDLERLLKNYRVKKENFQKEINSTSHYTYKTSDQFENISSNLELFIKHINDEFATVRKDTKMVRKYFSYTYRVKHFFLRLFNYY